MLSPCRLVPIVCWYHKLTGASLRHEHRFPSSLAFELHTFLVKMLCTVIKIGNLRSTPTPAAVFKSLCAFSKPTIIFEDSYLDYSLILFSDIYRLGKNSCPVEWSSFQICSNFNKLCTPFYDVFYFFKQSGVDMSFHSRVSPLPHYRNRGTRKGSGRIYAEHFGWGSVFCSF